MNAGHLNERLNVLRLTKTADGYGGYVQSYATSSTIWAKKRQKSGNIELQTGAISTFTEVEFIVRDQTAKEKIQDTDVIQVVGETEKYRINEIVEHQYKEFVKLRCTKID